MVLAEIFFFDSGSALAIDISFFLLLVLLVLYIIVKKIYTETWSGWSLESLIDWTMYLKLAIPGFIMIALEWCAWEFGNLILYPYFHFYKSQLKLNSFFKLFLQQARWEPCH